MQRLTQTLLLGLFLLFPQLTQAIASITVDDGIAGLPVIASIRGINANDSFDIVVQPPLGPAVVLPLQSNADNRGDVRIDGRETEVAGRYSIHVEQNTTVLSEVATFTILPDSFSAEHSTIESDNSSIQTNGSDAALVSVILRDRYNNPLSNRPVKLISSRSGDTIHAITNETDSTGSQTFRVSTVQAGTVTLRAMDLLSGELLGQDYAIQAGINAATPQTPQGAYPYYPYYPPYYNPFGANLFGSSPFAAQLQSSSFDVIDHFEIVAPRELDVNEDATITIIAQDKDKRTVEDYTGTVELESTDVSAYLPLNGTITFKESDLGEKTLTLGLRFREPGSHVLRAKDASNATIIGTANVTVEGNEEIGPVRRSISITSPADNSILRSRTFDLVGNGPPFINMDVLLVDNDEGIIIAQGDTDGDGQFTIKELTLDATTDTVILQIRSEDGRYESAPRTYTVDTDPPEITSIAFEPEAPEEEELTLLSITSDTNTTVTMKILNTDIEKTLSEDADAAGTFTTTFNAPPGGEYEILITVEDSGGLTTEQTEPFIVNAKEAPPEPDEIPPEITGIAFIPERPIASEPAQVIVRAEEKLPSVNVTLNDTDISLRLSEQTDAPGTYEASFIAPAGIQEYTVSVEAIDGGENVTEQQYTVEIISGGPPPLPIVQNLQIAAGPSSVELNWAPIDSSLIDGYTIYAGTDAENYNNDIQVDTSVSSVIIEELTPGTTYFFRMTTRQDDRESEATPPLRAIPLGMSIEVTPQHSSLLLDWSSLQSDAAIRTFILEYGVEPDIYVERRILNGELRLLNLEDLINDITYHLSLTPIDITGDFLDEYRVVASGTPNGEGFHLSAAEPVPDNVRPVAPEPQTVPPLQQDVFEQVPETVDTGLPISLFVLSIGIGFVVLVLYVRHRRTRKVTEEFLQMIQESDRR